MRLTNRKFSKTELKLIHWKMEKLRMGNTELQLAIKGACERLKKTLIIPQARLSRFLSSKNPEGVPEEIRELIEMALGLQRCILTLMPDRGPSIVPIQDLKVRIIDRRTATKLRILKNIPSFAEAVLGSRMKYFESLKEKLSEKNHFLQIAVVFTLKWPGEKEHWLVAKRAPRQTDLKYRLVTGKSILHAASFEMGGKSPGQIEAWLDLIRGNREEAEKDFCQTKSSVLTYLLRYKLNLQKYDPSFAPRGVVTNKKNGNYYSQYVFECRIAFSKEPSSTVFGQLSNDGTVLESVLKSESPEQVCTNVKGEVLAMDVAVWKGIISGEARTTYKTATFVKGFDLI